MKDFLIQTGVNPPFRMELQLEIIVEKGSRLNKRFVTILYNRWRTCCTSQK